jgi:hypothetical protein
VDGATWDYLQHVLGFQRFEYRVYYDAQQVLLALFQTVLT